MSEFHFLLVFYSNYTPKMHRMQTDRETNGRVTTSLNTPYTFDGGGEIIIHISHHSQRCSLRNSVLLFLI